MTTGAGGVSVVTGVVHICYHQLGVIDGGGDLPIGAAQRTNALVDVYEGAAVVATGIHTGVVTVTTETRATPPALVELDPWDEVVEVSVDMPQGDGRLAVLMDRVPATFGCLTPAGPGTYRLLPARQVLYKETDRYGAGWRGYERQ